jgi:hypothetical protein
MSVESLNQFIIRAWRFTMRGVRFCWREPGAAWLMFRMALWVALLTAAVKLMPLPRVMKLMTPARARRHAANPAQTQARLARLLDALLAADFWIFTPTCWKRAPVLYRYLALEGIASRILFGVRRGETGLLAGHAWLEAEGRPLLETTPPDYQVTFSFPA